MQKDIYIYIPNVHVIKYKDWVERIVNCDIIHNYK